MLRLPSPNCEGEPVPCYGSFCNLTTRIGPSKKPPRFPEEAFLTDVFCFPLAQLTLWPRIFKLTSKVHLGKQNDLIICMNSSFAQKNPIMMYRTH